MTASVLHFPSVTTADVSTCMAPVDDRPGVPPEDERLCGKPAVTERVIEEVAFPLCQEHAAEIDAETPPEATPQAT